MNVFKKKTTQIQRFIVQNEYYVLAKKQFILSTVSDLSVKVKLVLSRFETSNNTNSLEANLNTYNIFLLIVQYRNLLSSVGKYSFPVKVILIRSKRHLHIVQKGGVI